MSLSQPIAGIFPPISPMVVSTHLHDSIESKETSESEGERSPASSSFTSLGEASLLKIENTWLRQELAKAKKQCEWFRKEAVGIARAHNRNVTKLETLSDRYKVALAQIDYLSRLIACHEQKILNLRRQVNLLLESLALSGPDAYRKAQALINS